MKNLILCGIIAIVHVPWLHAMKADEYCDDYNDEKEEIVLPHKLPSRYKLYRVYSDEKKPNSIIVVDKNSNIVDYNTLRKSGDILFGPPV